MRCAITTVVVAASLALPTAALALDGRLQDGTSKTVIVWRNEKAHEEALALIRAGVHKSNPALLVPLIACAPVAGTRAVTTSAGMLTHDIIIVEGKDSGCRGNIPVEVLQR
jgi:hypothetical protein